MSTNDSFMMDFKSALFSPRQFFSNRFMAVDGKRLFLMSFLGMLLGLAGGNFISWILSDVIAQNWLLNKDIYLKAAQTLGLDEKTFLELIHTQKAYSLLILFLSPVISYMAPHIFGGALFIFTSLLARPHEKPITFPETFRCASASLTSMAWYMLPVFGPMVALVMLGMNTMRAFYQCFKIQGFMLGMSIFSALYVSFFLGSATLQLLARPFSTMLSN